jgi:hypothetical protein
MGLVVLRQLSSVRNDRMGLVVLRQLSSVRNDPHHAGVADAHRLVRKTEFGIVHVRTDGQRLLVVTRGAKAKNVEAYAYRVTASHDVQAVPVRKA